MQYANLGRTGLKVSRIALGCMSFGLQANEWRLDEAAGRKIIARALELGINFFDTANMYGKGESEIVLGRAIADLVPRDQVVIATKLFYPMSPDPNGRGLSRKAVLGAIDASLRRLGMEYVDLYQIHRWDEETPIDETMRALEDVVRSGKVRYLGASSMFAWQFMKAQQVARLSQQSTFVSVQPHYNLLNREEEREMLPMCRAEGIGVLPWSPLARGLLARPWKAVSTSNRAAFDRTAQMLYGDSEEADSRVVDAVQAAAHARGVSQAQMALAWLLAKPGITAPIVGAAKLSHLEDVVASLDIALSPSEIAAMEAPYKAHQISFIQEIPGSDQDR